MSPQKSYSDWAVDELIAIQIKKNDPPETKATLERLIAANYSEEEALKLIGEVMHTHIFQMVQEQEDFDVSRYVQDLKQLPNLPSYQENG